MDIAALSQTQTAGSATKPSGEGFGSLGSTEFFKLLITDLLSQDPLKPMDNGKLLEQIASIRDIEMNQEITSSLRSLIDQHGLARRRP